MKNINKFSKLAILFTGLYFLIGYLMSTKWYLLDYSTSWVSDIQLAQISVVGFLFVGSVLASVVFGRKSIIDSHRTNQKWQLRLIFLLTIYNLAMLGYLMIVWARIFFSF